jgi:hypothetical protein
MGIPQVGFGRYPTQAPQRAAAPNYSTGIDKIAGGLETINESEEAYRNLVQKKAEAIQARQIAEAKQLEDERGAKAKEDETNRYHQTQEKEKDRQYKADQDETGKLMKAGQEIASWMQSNPKDSRNAQMITAKTIEAYGNQGLKVPRAMNPPSSTTFNIRSGQEQKQAGLQIPPIEAELTQAMSSLNKTMGQEFTKTVLKSGLDPETFMRTNKQYALPDEKGKRAAIKANMARIFNLKEKLNITYSKANKEFPIEKWYPQVDSLNPAGLNLPQR